MQLKGLFLTATSISLAIVLLFASMSTMIAPISATTSIIQDEDVEAATPIDQYIVVLREDTSANTIKELLEEIENDVTVIHVYESALKGFAIKADQDNIDKIRTFPEVDFVEQDQPVQMFAQRLPTGIDRIDGDKSIALSGNGEGSHEVDIAIIDTGIDSVHPDLNVYKSVGFQGLVSSSLNGADDNGHGTHVAGIAAAKDNSIGVVGVAPGAKLWSVKVLNALGVGFISDVIAGVDYVTKHADEIEVANMSLGCECTSTALDMAIKNSVAEGVTYVVAAGNESSNASGFSPANHPDVIAVSAIVDTDGKCGGLGPKSNHGEDDKFASFSNFGDVVDIAAPGVNIRSTFLGAAYVTFSGTSMASPHVAGAAALYLLPDPSATPNNVKDSLISSGVFQSQKCKLQANNGYGGFEVNSDSEKQRLVYVAK